MVLALAGDSTITKFSIIYDFLLHFRFLSKRIYRFLSLFVLKLGVQTYVKQLKMKNSTHF